MSNKNHPNLNTIGLAVDILRAYYKRLKGQTHENNCVDINSTIQSFVEKVEEKLDHYILYRGKGGVERSGTIGPNIINPSSDKHKKQLIRLTTFLELDSVEYKDLGNSEIYVLTKDNRKLTIRASGNQHDGGFLTVGEEK